MLILRKFKWNLPALLLVFSLALSATIWSSAAADGHQDIVENSNRYLGRINITNHARVEVLPGVDVLSAGKSVFDPFSYGYWLWDDVSDYKSTQAENLSMGKKVKGDQTSSDVFWTWDGDMVNSVGTSNLIRYKKHIEGELTTTELPVGQAMTLWFIVFNNPELCSDGMCSANDMGADRPAQGDFLYASGLVVGEDGNATLDGRLKVGDIKGSGLGEFGDGCIPGLPDCGGPVGLVDLDGALVVLAVHSHGPELSKKELKSQVSTYLGGCEVFSGTADGGWAADASEVPDADYECATIQFSPHPPAP
jgi:hypothetical protein